MGLNTEKSQKSSKIGFPKKVLSILCFGSVAISLKNYRTDY